MASHNTLPDQEMALVSLAPFWGWIRQRMHACVLCLLLNLRTLSQKCRKAPWHFFFLILNAWIKTAVYTALSQTCSWDVALLQFELEHSTLLIIVEHSVLQAVYSAQNYAWNKTSLGKEPAVNSYMLHMWRPTQSQYDHRSRDELQISVNFMFSI